MKTRTLIATLLIAVIMLGIGYAQEKEPVALQETWYDIYMSDQKIGYVNNKIEKTNYQSKECYKFSNEMVMKIQADEKTSIESKMKSASFVDMDFRPIYIMDNELEAGQTKACSVTVTDDEITFKTMTNNEKPEITKIKNEPGLSYGIDGFILKTQGLLKVGTETSFKSISTKTKSIKTETVKILKEEKIKVNKEEIDTYYTETVDSESPDEIMQINIDKDGCVVLMKMAGMEVRRTNKNKAKNLSTTADITSMSVIKTNAQIPPEETNSIALLKLIMTFKKTYANVITKSEYQEIVQDENKYTITLKAVPGAVKNPVNLPVSAEAVRKYLNPSKLVLSQDKTIIAQAKEIIKDEKDGLKAAQLLHEWVSKNIKSESNSKDKTAKETLNDKAGDAEECVAFFSALGRSIGLPVRQVSGLLFDGSILIYHTWNEVYLGQWIPVDVSMSRVGIPAVYLKIGENEKGEKDRETAWPKMTQIMGNVSVEITAALDSDNKPIDLSGKKKE